MIDIDPFPPSVTRWIASLLATHLSCTLVAAHQKQAQMLHVSLFAIANICGGFPFASPRISAFAILCANGPGTRKLLYC